MFYRNFRCFYVLLNVVYYAEATDFILPANDSNNSDIGQMSQCILDIIDKNDFYQPTLAFIFDNYQNDALFNKILDILLQNHIPRVSVTNYSYINENNGLYNSNFIVINYIESCKHLKEFAEINLENFFKHIVILHKLIIIDCNNTLQESARRVAANDITFIYESKEDSTFKLVTNIPFLNRETCEPDTKVVYTEIGACKNGSMRNENLNLFPSKKPNNWMLCPLNVGMGALYPYIKSHNDSSQNLDILHDAHGSDVEIMKIVANYFNASLRFYNIKVIAENALSDLSFLPYLVNGTLEVCAGGLYRAFGDMISYSGIYSRQTIIWIYTVERDIRSWSTFVERTDGFYIFIFFYLLHSIVWTLITYFDENIEPFTNTLIYSWGAILGTASLRDARTLKQKIVNLFYLLLCLHLSAYISIQLYAFLTIQGPPYVYKDTNDLSRSGRPLYLKDMAKYFVDDEKYVAFANTSDNCDDFLDCVAKTQRNKGMTLIIDGLFADVQTGTVKNYEATILKATEGVLGVYHEMLIRKESTLVGRIEHVIQRLFEAGICNRLFEESIGILVIDRAQRANQNMMSNSYSCEIGCEIKLSQCAEAFYVWVLGCILSCFIFMGELFMKRRRM